MKKILLILAVFFLLIPVIPSSGTTQRQTPSVQTSNQFAFSEIFVNNITDISIENIADGRGITATVKNRGESPLDNLTVIVEKINGSFVWVQPKSFALGSLGPNESIDIHIRLFGIGLGAFLSLPEILIAVSTPENTQKEVVMTTKVFGFLTKIVTTYFYDEGFNGFLLFSPEYSTKSLVMNKQGEIVHTWESNYIQGLGLLLLENGDLLRTILLNNPLFIAGGTTGGVELSDWNGTRLWQFNYSNAQHCLHHSIEILPNGHLLMVAWEYKTAQEAIAAGRDPETLPEGELWPDHVIEVEQTGPSEGSIVWEWHVWDHLIQDFDPTKENYGTVAQHPELVDINYMEVVGKERADWNHINSIDYNKEFDQILLSACHQNEIWVIDHSTTTQEAAGHTGGRSGKGGDLLYRYGNPATYGAGTALDRQLFGQHDAQWIQTGTPGEGHILVFNNGQGRPDGQYSSVDELVPPVDENGSYYLEPGSAYGPLEPLWRYMAENPSDFFAGYLSSAQRLPNGNTLICDGDHGVFFEVTLQKKTVWYFHNTLPTPLTNQVFKALCYPPDYPGLQNLTS